MIRLLLSLLLLLIVPTEIPRDLTGTLPPIHPPAKCDGPCCWDWYDWFVSGPGVEAEAGHNYVDFDNDGDIDLADFAELQRRWPHCHDYE